MTRSFWTVAIAILALTAFAGGTDHSAPAHAPKPAAAHVPAAAPLAKKAEVKFTTPDVPAAEETPETDHSAEAKSKPAAAPAPVTKTETAHAPAIGDAHAAPAPAATGPDALEKLMAGNKRYTQNLAAHPNQNSERRISVAMSQKPFAIIFTCADSRVAPEVVFDQGLGDLFVVRVAGNVVDPIVLGSIEYAVDHLGAGLVVVMGHERCGAVHAAVTSATAATSEHAAETGEDHVGAILAKIAPAAAEARKAGGDVTDAAVRINVENVVNELKTTKGPLAAKAAAGKVRIVGARYDLDTGIVEFLQSGSTTTTTQVETHAEH